MEATLPLATLEGKEYFATAIEIAIPFGILWIHEMAPHVIVYALEPLQALLVASEFVALNHGDKSLDVYPPEFLVPF
jgi:hypothetical protein